MLALRFRSTLSLALVTLISACGGAGITTEATTDEQPAASMLATPSFSVARSENALKPALEAEKRRIAREGELSKPIYDQLKREWERQTQNRAVDPRLLVCDPLQYAADTKIIGPQGGDMSIGPHKLSIPKGALTGFVVITGEAPVSLNVAVKLSPHGLTFLKAPELMLSYKHCHRPAQFRERIAYVNDAGFIIEWPESRDGGSGEVFARIWHFSRYAVAW